MNMTDDKPTRSLVTVTSVVGHVFSLGFVQEEEGQDRAYNDPSEYFRIPVVKQEEGSTGKLRVVDHLRALAAESDHLVLWLDCDAEGENIAHEVIGVTRQALEQKAAVEARNSPEAPPQRHVHRARFSAITGDALRDAFCNLVEPDAELSRSVDARQELDLRVGVAITRLLTWRCVGLARQNFSPATKFVSYGPCQTPALSFCVDRAREIEAFVPQDYWRVRIAADCPGNGRINLLWIPPQGTEVKSTNVSRRCANKDGETTDIVEDSATFDQKAAEQVVKEASKANSEAEIIHVDQVSERINPPFGLNTVALLSAGSKAMGMSPKKVMQVAEKLYSAGFISYPRTETTRYDPKGFDVRTILRDHAGHPEWGRTASYLLRTKYKRSERPPLRGHDAGDHPPITCLKAASRDEVGGGTAWRVYEFVARNFLGSLSDELQYTRRVAQLRLDADDTTHKFLFEQVHVDSLGFAGACRWVLRDIGAEQKNESSSEATVLKEGMVLPIADAQSERRATRPPRFLQEHELIELMDTTRIGTDASMATHVSNIVDRGYVTLCDETGVLLRPPRPPRPGQRQLPRQIGRYLVPTPLGIGLMDLFDKTAQIDGALQHEDSPALLSRPAIRAQMEEEVKQIANGELDKSTCVDRNLAWFEARYDELVKSLSRDRLNEFARALRPTKDALHYWRRLGAFEPRQDQHHKKSRPHRNGSSKGGRSSYNGNVSKGGRRSQKSRGPKRTNNQTVKR
jgi:DNA topoisomerase-3